MIIIALVTKSRRDTETEIQMRERYSSVHGLANFGLMKIIIADIITLIVKKMTAAKKMKV